MIKHRPFVFLDIETTGGSKTSSRITEVGALRVENGRVVDTFKQLINPEQLVPWYITKLTGIDNEMVWSAPTFRGIADDLERFLSDSIFVAHNVNFDYQFIKMEYESIGYEFKMDRMCSAKLSRLLYPQYRSHALDMIIKRKKLNVVNRHRALDDANVICEFFTDELNKDELRLFSAINKLIIWSKTVEKYHTQTHNESLFD